MKYYPSENPQLEKRTKKLKHIQMLVLESQEKNPEQ